MPPTSVKPHIDGCNDYKMRIGFLLNPVKNPGPFTFFYDQPLVCRKIVKIDIVANIEKDQSLKALLHDFFFVLDQKEMKNAMNSEENLYDKFLLDQAKDTRDRVLEAMFMVCSPSGNFLAHKKSIEVRHGNKARVCKNRFAACLRAMGMECKQSHGLRYWINIGMRRKPRFRNEK